jgi:glutathione synthase/RimK-type ligase-like ATP-grasp enzyme
VLNKRNGIILASDKLRALQTMQQQHVPCPRVFTATQPVTHIPVVGRKTHHTQGRDVMLCLQQIDVQRAINQGCTHFTQLLPKAREFRVHVFNGEVLKISEKVLTDADKYHSVVWNFDNGFTFRQLRNVPRALKDRLSTAGIGAVEAMGLDFGAADIVLTDDSNIYVLEVNTGPSLAQNSLATYARKFGEILGITVTLTETDDDLADAD